MPRAKAGSTAGKKSTERDPGRFYCPFPGCKRSFAELWRLKVHYRAPPNIRGSGRERGHNTELKHCSRCHEALIVGKVHVCNKSPTASPADSTEQDYQEPLAKAESAERLPGIRKETTSDSEKARPEDAEPLLFLRSRPDGAFPRKRDCTEASATSSLQDSLAPTFKRGRRASPAPFAYDPEVLHSLLSSTALPAPAVPQQPPVLKHSQWGTDHWPCDSQADLSLRDRDAWEQQLSPSVSPNGLDTPHSVHSSLTVEDSSLDQVASGWHNGTHSSSMHAHTRFLDASCCAPMRTPAWQDCLALRNSQLGHAAYDTSYGSFGTSQAYSRLTGFGIVQGQNPFVPQEMWAQSDSMIMGMDQMTSSPSQLLWQVPNLPDPELGVAMASFLSSGMAMP